LRVLVILDHPFTAVVGVVYSKSKSILQSCNPAILQSCNPAILWTADTSKSRRCNRYSNTAVA
jgi:hypothetical protein